MLITLLSLVCVRQRWAGVAAATFPYSNADAILPAVNFSAFCKSVVIFPMYPTLHLLNDCDFQPALLFAIFVRFLPC
jgi:hypothetical protein